MRVSMVQWWSQRLRQLRNRTFLRAAMAAGALVSTADHDVRLSEQLALDDLLARLEELRVYDVHVGVELHRGYAERIKADPEKGRRTAIDAISAFRGDEEHGLLILYVAATIAGADQELTATEQQTLAEIADALGLSAQEALARIWGPAAQAAGRENA